MKNLPTELIFIICDYLYDKKRALAQVCLINRTFKEITHNTLTYQVLYLLKDCPSGCNSFKFLCDKTNRSKLLMYYNLKSLQYEDNLCVKLSPGTYKMDSLVNTNCSRITIIGDPRDIVCKSIGGDITIDGTTITINNPKIDLDLLQVGDVLLLYHNLGKNELTIKNIDRTSNFCWKFDVNCHIYASKFDMIVLPNCIVISNGTEINFETTFINGLTIV